MLARPPSGDVLAKPTSCKLSTVVPSEEPATQIVGRYALYGEIASGGMATVHYGRLLGPAGFSRTVAIKRLHAGYAKDPEFVSMFLDEARLAARIRHPNVVPTLDVVATSGELFLVMEYVQGESLGRLVRAMSTRGETTLPSIVAAVMSGVLHGLHAAHEATSEQGKPLGIVHRDVSPQNILVGTDGVTRVLDFGVAKAVGRLQTTREGQIKGKLAYMPPEQLRGEKMTRQADIYASSVVLWETLTGRRLFSGDNEGVIVARILESKVEPPGRLVPGLPEAFDELTLRGLSRDPSKRFATAREMALALERCVGLAPASEIGAWVETMATHVLAMRAKRIAEIESSSPSGVRLEPARADAASRESRSSPNFLDFMQASSHTQTATRPASKSGPSYAAGALTPADGSGTRGRTASTPSGSSGLPRFDDPDLADHEPMQTSTGAQLSSSLSRSRTLARPPGSWVAMAVLASTALGLVLGTYALSRSKPSASPGAEPASFSSPLATASTAYPVGGAEGGSSWSVVDPKAAPVVNPTQLPLSPQAGVTGPRHLVRQRTAAPAPPPPVTKHKEKDKDCDPPYTLDDEGHRQYKLNCFP